MYASKWCQRSFLFLTSAILILSMLLIGCGPSTADLEAVDYTPLTRDDWKVSTPSEQGLDPMLVAELYHDAADLETLYGLLVIKNGHLIAEEYFNEGSVDQKVNMKSVTKSYASAFVGIALDQGCLSSVDQKMLDFFPELVDQITDPRKEQITIRQLLQMRAGYPWEESNAELFELLYTGFRPSNLVDVPLTRDPGSDFDYSNLTSHLLGILVARACDTDLKSFAQELLFSPLDAEVGFWQQDWEGYYLSYADVHFSARDMAKFGLVYLNEGEYEGNQVLSADWIGDSLQRYSDVTYFTGGRKKGSYFLDLGYGYQWWSARAGDHHFDYASGHGGQYIVLLGELDMIIVTTADPMHGEHGGDAWKEEKAITNLVGKFIKSLPSE